MRIPSDVTGLRSSGVALAFLALAALLVPAPESCAAPANLVANGSFEQAQRVAGVPDFWVAAGNPSVRQQLTLDAGADGGRCAKLECTRFEGDTPDCHAMLCQLGQVSVRQGQWYRLTFHAKAAGVRAGALEVALVDTRAWDNAGLAEAFPATLQWQAFEFRFRAPRNLAAASSRLQFWFHGTGTLWLDDVVLAESAEGQQWFPQLEFQGAKNLLPNSSFECGGAGWGSYTYGLSGWAGNLYRLEGDVDARERAHGGHSLKIALTPQTLPVFWFDYYEPIRQPVRRVLAANQGWCRVQPGEQLTLSAFLRADTPGAIAQLAVVQAPSDVRRRQVAVDTTWQRYAFTFAPTQPFLFVAVGLDLEASKRDAATLWVDAVQLERGERATEYTPRQTVEAFLETDVAGNLFTDPHQGASLTVRAFNAATEPQEIRGQLTLTDFFEHTVLSNRLALSVPAKTGTALKLDPAAVGRRGFFRASWTTEHGAQSLRLAILEPTAPGADDSPFGFNHAYPWDFLVRLARTAGIVWWRDWSAKWQTLEPQRGQFDFTVADAQIRRVLALDSQVEVLLPFPSASWCTTARPEEVAKAAGNSGYLRARLPLAYAPGDLGDFAHYAAQVARHYGQLQPRRVTTYQILNEPLYTDYALPRKFGYALEDYLRLLEAAHHALKTADPQCRVVGGISANLEAGLTREFVRQGGLRWVDVFDLHLYDPPRAADTYETPFLELEQLMRAHGGPKPVWITEWGCYADDDPPCLPPTVGDAAMNRSRWASERAATEHLVRFAAVALAHGVRKIFFHAGTCGAINSPDAGGVLFEYGGAPRKMLSGVAAFSQLLGVPDACVKTVDREGLRAFVFRARNRAVAVAWCTSSPTLWRGLAAGVRAYDIMGNELVAPELVLGESPWFLVGPKADDVVAALER